MTKLYLYHECLICVDQNTHNFTFPRELITPEFFLKYNVKVNFTILKKETFSKDLEKKENLHQALRNIGVINYSTFTRAETQERDLQQLMSKNILITFEGDEMYYLLDFLDSKFKLEKGCFKRQIDIGRKISEVHTSSLYH